MAVVWCYIINKDISHIPITELENNSEQVWVKVFANKVSHYVGSWYIYWQPETSNCSEIKLTTPGTNIKPHPPFMFQLQKYWLAI